MTWTIPLALAMALLPGAALALTDSPRDAPVVTATTVRVQEVAGHRWVDIETGATVAAFGLAAGPYSGSSETAARAYLDAAAEQYGLASGARDLETRAPM
jgi:hypothetical protein